MPPFPILMYHAIEPPAGAGPEPPCDPAEFRYTLPLASFEAQLDALARAGARTPADWAEVDRPAPAPGQAWITFDDGHASDLGLALPALQRHGLRGIFFITTGWIGRPGYLGEAQIRDLRAAGMLIGAHGQTHRLFSRLGADEVRSELTHSRRLLEEILNEPVTAMSLPGGRAHPQLRELARETGYKHVFTSEVALAAPQGDPLAWPRLPMTRDLKQDFALRLATGDPAAVSTLARKVQLRVFLRRLLGRE